MTDITKAEEKKLQLLVELGKQSFIESHGNSATIDVINNYVDKTYSSEAFKSELSDPKNVYHIIYHNGKPAGYSKIIFNTPDPNIQLQNVTKLERFYLLKEFYSLNLGSELLNFLITLSKRNDQSGIWLFVWKENHRAVRFYTKAGFKIVGSYDFKLSEKHANPNHQILLRY